MSPTPERRSVVFALGANLGEPLAALREAALRLAGDLDSARVSGVYRTPPEGGADQPEYLNAVVSGQARLTPAEALALADRLERAAGRVRSAPGAPRVLDVDVLFVGEEVVDEPGLHVPHPRWEGRDFVVIPLLDVAADLRDPRSGRTVADVAEGAGWETGRLRAVLPPGALFTSEVR